MNIQTFLKFLGWTTLINMGLLFLWSLMLVFSRNFIFKVHNRFWPELSKESLVKIHYSGMVFYKMIIIAFLLIPYISLKITGF